MEEKLCNLKDDILSCLTDKNTKFVATENEDESTGALLAISKAFNDVSKVFEKYNI